MNLFKKFVATIVTIVVVAVVLILWSRMTAWILNSNYDAMNTLFLMLFTGAMAVSGAGAGAFVLMVKVLGIKIDSTTPGAS